MNYFGNVPAVDQDGPPLVEHQPVAADDVHSSPNGDVEQHHSPPRSARPRVSPNGNGTNLDAPTTFVNTFSHPTPDNQPAFPFFNPDQDVGAPVATNSLKPSRSKGAVGVPVQVDDEPDEEEEEDEEVPQSHVQAHVQPTAAQPYGFPAQPGTFYPSGVMPVPFYPSMHSMPPMPHYMMQPPPPLPSTPTKGKRRQVKNACTNCQRACKKCDECRPCVRCVKYGLSEGCLDSKRKERKKGVKRGPYKKREREAREPGYIVEHGDPSAAAHYAPGQAIAFYPPYPGAPPPGAPSPYPAPYQYYMAHAPASVDGSAPAPPPVAYPYPFYPGQAPYGHYPVDPNMQYQMYPGPHPSAPGPVIPRRARDAPGSQSGEGSGSASRPASGGKATKAKGSAATQNTGKGSGKKKVAKAAKASVS